MVPSWIWIGFWFSLCTERIFITVRRLNRALRVWIQFLVVRIKFTVLQDSVFSHYLMRGVS